MSDLVERLRRASATLDEVHAMEEFVTMDKDVVFPSIALHEEAADLIEQQAAEIRTLREALEPFAALASDYLADTVNFDDDTIMAGRITRRREEGTPPRVSFADFRRARAALSPKGDTADAT